MTKLIKKKKKIIQTHNVWFGDCISFTTVAFLEVLWQDIDVPWYFPDCLSEYLDCKWETLYQREMKQQRSFRRKPSQGNNSESLLWRVKVHIQENHLKFFLPAKFPSWSTKSQSWLRYVKNCSQHKISEYKVTNGQASLWLNLYPPIKCFTFICYSVIIVSCSWIFFSQSCFPFYSSFSPPSKFQKAPVVS